MKVSGFGLASSQSFRFWTGKFSNTCPLIFIWLTVKLFFVFNSNSCFEAQQTPSDWSVSSGANKRPAELFQRVCVVKKKTMRQVKREIKRLFGTHLLHKWLKRWLEVHSWWSGRAFFRTSGPGCTQRIRQVVESGASSEFHSRWT